MTVLQILEKSSMSYLREISHKIWSFFFPERPCSFKKKKSFIEHFLFFLGLYIEALTLISYPYTQVGRQPEKFFSGTYHKHRTHKHNTAYNTQHTSQNTAG